MLNPNNIKGKSFDTEKNGYSKEDVKEFLGQVAEDYAEVVKANQDTEAKIIKLVEKINEYREDEEAIQVRKRGTTYRSLLPASINEKRLEPSTRSPQVKIASR